MRHLASGRSSSSPEPPSHSLSNQGATRHRTHRPRLRPRIGADALAEAYFQPGAIPAKKRHDGRPVAIAIVAGLEVVVTWNHRHLAHERKWTLFNAVNRLAGYEQPLIILTPFEVMT